MLYKMSFLQKICFCLGLCLVYVSGEAPVQSRDADPKDVKKVHLIFMNHLDVGFNGIRPQLGFINNVLNKYFTVYFPQAVKVGLQLYMLGYAEKLMYMSHPWLVSMYLDCPPNLVLAGIQLQCPNKTELSNFEAAIKMGIITWHAGPMNMNNEMFDPSMVDYTLQISEDLDKRFGIKRPTRVVSQRDVPGMSIALLPLYAKHGIEGISVGVNGGSAPPAVPKIFRWEYQNASLIGMWHPRGYPDPPGKYPARALGLSAKDCVTFEGLDEAMCYAFKSDNQGPPASMAEVLIFYELARGQFPNAHIQASTFEEFVAAAQVVKAELPLVTQEIGDTWIQGSASDPMKVAMMRAFFRTRTNCLLKASTGNASSCPNDEQMYNASRFLTKLGEHTWGIAQAGDLINWENDIFYKFLENQTSLYMQGPLSWIEQRQFNDLALDALGDHPLAEQVSAEWKQLRASIPDFTDYHLVTDRTAMMSCNQGYKFQFAADGSIIALVDKNGVNWASPTNPLGQYVYQTYNQTDFDRFGSIYDTGKFQVGIYKPNMTKNCRAQSKPWAHTVTDLYQANDGSCKFGVNLIPVETEATFYYGAPPKVCIRYSVETDSQGRPGVAVDFQFYAKPPTRMPEAIFLTFKPVEQEGHRWLVHKLGQLLDPLNVVQNGSQTQHGIDKGVYYVDSASKGLEILSPDVAIATMLTSTSPLSAIPNQLSPLKDVNGVSFNIFNNVWNVNYIFWYPYLLDDMNYRSRFFITFL
ncbi:uncharacterized protein LOC124113675 isoform X1 [Haliotis rufescens]|uniref:uncharacterized protein LOC124113675 isoform X1 n=3 Tax=Haliotis rufescens TaxID=6454 RepID=UPI00201EFFAA|nr:uncharacterized protein LOC124113675 isoform X1 [Haliotis rufescens]